MIDYSFKRNYQTRLVGSVAIVSALFLFIVCKLFYLQIIKGKTYKSYSDRNRIMKEWIPAPRGIIYDRNGVEIVGNRASFDITLTPAYTHNLNETLEYLHDKLASYSPFSVVELEEKIRKSNRNRPIIILKDIPWDVLAVVEAHKYMPLLDGINVRTSATRDYKFDKMGAHFVGYLGEITKNKLKEMNSETEQYQYQMGQYLGKFGVEYTFEKFLRGKFGVRPSEVDVHGRIQPVSKSNQFITAELSRQPEMGMNLTTTIDMNLQKVAYESFTEFESGAIVAVDPNNGDILALISSPAYDPELFSRGINRREWMELNYDPLLPLMDKTVRGQYPPGSTFKMIMAIAGLETGRISEKTRIHCPGYVNFYGRQYRCWKEKGHGSMNVVSAIAQSCDSFFYLLATNLGVDTIARYAQYFGLGKKTGVGLNFENTGLVPTSAWKKARFGEKWWAGETLSLAIGQGYTNVTPLQLAKMAALLSLRGVNSPLSLRIFRSIGGPDAGVEFNPGQNEVLDDSIKISPKTWDLIHQGMKDVVNAGGGTAYWNARSEKYLISGKTGTAQVIAMKAGERREDTPSNKFLEDHALFVAFAPSEDPKIAVAVVVEHGGHGSSAAAPKAKKVIEAYLDGLYARNQKTAN